MFGDYIKEKRLEKSYSVREMARMLGCSASYVSAVENNSRNPYDRNRLSRLASILEMTKEEKDKMYMLAGSSKNVKSGDTVSADLSDYIKENDFVGYALRTARDLNAGEEEWNAFIRDLKEKKG